ncbi:MAG: hypothetical protein RLZZ241_2492 [Bacteroidota bacterium]|jgi:hypothetical protein
MKINNLFLGFLLFTAACQQKPQPDTTMEADVAVLANDSLSGRETGTVGAQKAAAYLKTRMEQMGLKPAASGSYFQEFSFKPRKGPHGEVEFGQASDSNITGINIVGLVDKGGARTIILGAHYDHLGMGGEGSLHRGEPAIHNGADDNASGVALLLQLANRLQNWKEAKDNYLILSFSGEEIGLLGSNFFAKNPTLQLSTVPYMLNFDMVGRLRQDSTLSVSGTGTTPIWPQLLNAVNPGFKLVLSESGVGPSDHTSFYLQDLPVLHFFTGQHEDYHRPSDDAEKLNYVGMELMADYVFDLIKAMESEELVPFRKTKNESEETPRFKVGLGVVPDYLFDGTGMRIDGVSEGKPAQAAGLQKGDVVVKLGDSVITDMMSYMRALSGFEAGQNTSVEVIRNGENVKANIQF